MRGIVSTTHVDSHNMRMTKKALENAAQQINEGAVPGVGVDHDVLIPPIGKVVKAQVIKLEDGEFGLFAEQEIFEEKNTVEIRLPSGELAYMDTWSDTRPFIDKYETASEKIEVLYDPVNFESEESMESLENELNEDELIEISTSNLLRKSIIPDPELIMHLSNRAIELLIAHKVLKSAGKKITDDISNDLSNVYTTLRTTMIKYAKYCVPKNRPVTYIIIAAGTPTIEFVIRTADVTQVFDGITTEYLSTKIKEVEELNKSFDVQKIQFNFGENNEWEFNYLLTKDGKVIGSQESNKRRAKAVEIRLKDLNNIQASPQGRQNE